MLAHAVDYGPDGPVDYASGARCGLRFAVDWWIRERWGE